MSKVFLVIAVVAFLVTSIAVSFGKQQATITATPPIQTAAANAFKLALPINCTLGKDCYIMHYVDLDPSPAAVDFGCGRQTYDGHKGTDFAISDERKMAEGVAVLAAAPGKVIRVRDGVPDKRIADQTDRTRIEGIECGNGVVIDHGNGWQTQYCHLRNGSVAVKRNTTVAAGTVLGMVGESGLTSFPHVHLTVRYQGKVVDPFVGLDDGSGCKATRKPLWEVPLEYVPTGSIRAGFATLAPKLADVWEGRFFETELSKNSPSLIFWVQAFGVLQGDEEQFRMISPDGKRPIDRKKQVKSSKRAWLSYVGTKASVNQPLIPGLWRGEYRLIRNGKVLIDLNREVQLR